MCFLSFEAYGIMYCMCSGALYDSIGDFDVGFYFSGAVIFLSGAMLFAIPSMQRQDKPVNFFHYLSIS
jgi:hypothetical protein